MKYMYTRGYRSYSIIRMRFLNRRPRTIKCLLLIAVLLFVLYGYNRWLSYIHHNLGTNGIQGRQLAVQLNTTETRNYRVVKLVPGSYTGTIAGVRDEIIPASHTKSPKERLIADRNTDSPKLTTGSRDDELYKSADRTQDSQLVPAQKYRASVQVPSQLEIVHRELEVENDQPTPINYVLNPDRKNTKVTPKFHQTFTQHDNISDYIGEHLIVRVFSRNFTLINGGQERIPPGDWRIYLDSLSGLTLTSKCVMTSHHVNGALYYLTPKTEFQGIKPAQIISCELSTPRSRSHHYPNWFVAAPGKKASLIKSTAGEALNYVRFTDSVQILTEKYRKHPIDSKKDNLDKHARDNDIDKIKRHVIPTPVEVKVNETLMTIFNKDTWSIIRCPDFENEEKFLSDMLSTDVRTAARSRYIRLVRSTSDLTGPEEYTLEVNPEAEVITISTATSRGAFYGVQSIISLIEGSQGKLPYIRIKDKPRFSYRGVMLDVARNFKTKATILKFIDAMSTYKLNRLHLHLTDDEGWRLEIPGIPELTQFGSKRCYSASWPQCLIPNLGSGPDNSTSGSGYYSVADYREILEFAKRRHVVIIPEVDMPGHMRAAIHAMEFREMRRRAADGNHDNEQSLLLTDHSSMAQSVQHWTNNTLNPCLNSSYLFLEKVIGEIAHLHRDIQPLQIFHIGGDEIPASVWSQSPSCLRRLKIFRGKTISDTSILRSLFVRMVSSILQKHNLTMALWETDLVSTRQGLMSAISLSPRNMAVTPLSFVWKQAQNTANLQAKGYQVVLSLASHLYFDHQYEVHPEERGLHWATSFIDTRKVFLFRPSDVTDTATGIQACMWSETIRNEVQLEYMLFPRVLALAERAWHLSSWEHGQRKIDSGNQLQDWQLFADTLGHKELPRLEKHGIRYRIPPPTASIQDGKLVIHQLYPGHLLEVSQNNGVTWEPVKSDIDVRKLSRFIQLRSRSPVLGRSSRVIKFKIVRRLD